MEVGWVEFCACRHMAALAEGCRGEAAKGHMLRNTAVWLGDNNKGWLFKSPIFPLEPPCPLVPVATLMQLSCYPPFPVPPQAAPSP